MAEKAEQMEPKEREIPVLTVLKNNCILKNIFLLDKPPSVHSFSPLPVAENVDGESEVEEVLLVGRHPDCKIVLQHPSISRFHLRIHSKPSSRSLSVTDLASVHGTWVSSSRIEPGVRVKVNEGENLKLGASSRLYRVSWVPLSRAYDKDDPFVPAMDASDTVDEETEVAMDEDGDGVSYRNKEQYLGNNVDGQDRLLSNEDIRLFMPKMSPIASSLLEDKAENNSSPEICSNIENSNGQLCQTDESVTVVEEAEEVIDKVEIMNFLESFLDENCSSESMLKDQHASLDRDGEIFTPDKGNTSPNSYLVRSLKCKFEETSKGDSISNTAISSVDLDEGIFTPDKENVILNDHLLRSMKNVGRSGEVKHAKSFRPSPLKMASTSNMDQEDNLLPALNKANQHQKVLQELKSTYSVSGSHDSLKKQQTVLQAKSAQIETIQSNGNCAGVNMSSQVGLLLDENSSSGSMLKDQYACICNEDGIFTPDKENMSPNPCLVMSLKCKSEETLKDELISHTPNSSVDQNEEIFTPDKENVTPNSHLLRSMENIGKLGEIKHPNSYRPSPLKIPAHKMCQEDVLLPSFDEASQHQKVLHESKSTFCISKSPSSLKKQQSLKAGAGREPFGPLPVNHSIPPVHEGTVRGCRSIDYLESEDANQPHKNSMMAGKNRWTIIADTTSLLNRKSRKELQLLRGLRGTTLVIPGIVVRELDCMLRRASFFSRVSEASVAVNWIKECMSETKWWIHVQSSADEAMLVPPTPPAASSHLFGEDRSVLSVGSNPFSPNTLQEIVIPTTADHMLECALLFGRIMNGQLVLLSDDVTLKIKAMAEGLICETAEKFRGSLVNPFSARFLYSNSSPIGPTWSCSDDTLLKERYYPSPKKAPKSGEGAKGLKLILLHNSNFRHMAN